MKKYKIKVDEKMIAALKPFWRELQSAESKFFDDVQKIEKHMARTVKIEDIEFFMNDGYYCGIGNGARTMRLIHDRELENNA